MTTVRMDVAAARSLAASITADSRALDVVWRDIVPTYGSALHLLDVTPYMGLPVAAAQSVAQELSDIATDIEWRADLLEEADAEFDALGRSIGEIPQRRLDHISLSATELGRRVLSDSPALRAAALHETLIRAEAEPDAAVELLTWLGADRLAGVLTQLQADFSGDFGAWAALAMIMARAAQSGNQPVLTVLAEATTALHFRHQDSMLRVIQSNFVALDTAAHGGGADGRMSVADLQAVTDAGTELGAAATWLLDNPEVLAWLFMGATNSTYLDADGGFDPLTIQEPFFERGDIAAYRVRRDTAYTLWPILGAIDTAAQDDPSLADGLVSRDDFIAALAWPELSDHQTEAIHQVLRDGAYNTRGYSGTALTVASWAPFVGDMVDGVAAVYFAGNGDYARAAQHAVGLIPVPGVNGSTTRLLTREAAQRILGNGAKATGADLTGRTVENVVAWSARTPARLLFDSAANSSVLRPAIINPHDG